MADEAKQEKEQGSIDIHFQGDWYHIDFLDFNALEVQHFRKEFGHSIMQAFQNFDLDTAAQLLYIYKRKQNPRTEYKKIAQSFTYRDLNKTVSKAEDDGIAEPGSASIVYLESGEMDFTSEGS